MSARKARAIVLRSRQFGEADRILTLISAEDGIFDAKLKGARKPKSKLGPACQQFSTVELSLFPGKTMDIVTEASLVRSSEKLETDIVRLSYANLVAEITLKMSVEKLPDKRAYLLMEGALGSLSAGVPPSIVASAFMIKRLYIDGVMPQISNCSMCRSKDGLHWFSAETGGSLCPSCAAEAPAVMRLEPDARELAILLYRSTWDEIAAVAGDLETLEDLEAALAAFFSFRGDMRIKSLETLNLLKDAKAGVLRR
jgi:DNA repair protein RecO (recombination protein O)